MLQAFKASLRQQVRPPKRKRNWVITYDFIYIKYPQQAYSLAQKSVDWRKQRKRQTDRQTTERDNNRTFSGVMKTLKLYGSKCTQCHICCCLWYRELNSGHPNGGLLVSCAPCPVSLNLAHFKGCQVLR